MKNLFILAFLSSMYWGYAQNDSLLLASESTQNETSYFTYPEDFSNDILRFKPFMVSYNTLGAEMEVFNGKTPTSYVFGSEFTFLDDNNTKIEGFALEADRRIYLNRSIRQKRHSEIMFYMSYGIKYGMYRTAFSYETYEGGIINSDGYTESEYVVHHVNQRFDKLSVNLKVGLHFLFFKKISIDTNIGAGIRYNTRSVQEPTYYDNFTYRMVIKQGIRPTIHMSIGLAK